MRKLKEMTGVELTNLINDAVLKLIRKVYKEGYNNGYGQGKYSQRLDSAINEVANITNGIGINVGETEQERRDRIVERAKEDVEFLVGDIAPKVEYVVNKNKRTIAALLKHSTCGFVVSRGIAKCAPSDCFNVHIGKAIALRRALGLEVPDEYLNAPQPTEVRVGDVVRFPTGQVPNNLYEVISLSDKWNLRLVKNMYSDHGVGLTAHVDDFIDAKIIDDSRE